MGKVDRQRMLTMVRMMMMMKIMVMVMMTITIVVMIMMMMMMERAISEAQFACQHEHLSLSEKCFPSLL